MGTTLINKRMIDFRNHVLRHSGLQPSFDAVRQLIGCDADCTHTCLMDHAAMSGVLSVVTTIIATAAENCGRYDEYLDLVQELDS